MLRGHGIDLVLDVGAHAGEYGKNLRAAGYQGKIVSFEPIDSHFERLLAAAADDANWECQNRAGGARSETSTINVSANDGFSSSLLTMTRAHEEAASGSHFEREQTIEIVSLDEALSVTPSLPPTFVVPKGRHAGV